MRRLLEATIQQQFQSPGETTREVREIDVPPHLGYVHVDHALRRPDPVIAGRSFTAQIPALVVIELPLDAREVHPPGIPGFWRAVRAGIFGHTRPRDGDLHRPAAVYIVGAIQRAIHLHGVADADEVPRMVRFAAFVVGFRQVQIPNRIERIDLEFHVSLISTNNSD